MVNLGTPLNPLDHFREAGHLPEPAEPGMASPQRI
jgi:hypothetical protein